jgi:hypothetical protein
MYEYGPNAIGNAHHTRRRRTSYSQAGQGQYAGHTSRTQENKREEKARRRGKGAPLRQGGAVEAEGGALEASHRSTPYYSILTRGREAVYVILPCTGYLLGWNRTQPTSLYRSVGLSPNTEPGYYRRVEEETKDDNFAQDDRKGAVPM